MGVWIETCSYEEGKVFAESHPVWVCGLKQQESLRVGSRSGHTLYGCVD